jgi:hypothetical protein
MPVRHGLLPGDTHCGGAAVPFSLRHEWHADTTFTTPVRLEGPWPASVRRIGVMCTEGGLSTAALNHLVVERDPATMLGAEDRLAPGKWKLHELATGHWAMITMPAALAELLHVVAQESHGPLAKREWLAHACGAQEPKAFEVVAPIEVVDPVIVVVELDCVVLG